MCRAAGHTGRAPSPPANGAPAPTSPRPDRPPRAGITSAREWELLQQVKATVPRLSSALGKGECGSIAVFGGCVMFSGAAYHTAIAALRCGADLVHVFCEKEAGPVVRSYGPELIVHPVLDQEYGLEEIEHWLPRLHCVVLGPGLGRNQSMGGRLALVLERVKALNLPVVLDADGLWHLATNPTMLRGYPRAIITPSPQEFSRLARGVLNREVAPSLCPDPENVSDLARALGHLTVLHKGAHDVISDGRITEHCLATGSPRRCGGQGDLLAGLLATFLGWGRWDQAESPCLVAAWGACRLARACAAAAFAEQGRAMLTTDMVASINVEFARLYESETFL
jgi:ATP-dependent NAD(P)H-hydrate dehydratase